MKINKEDCPRDINLVTEDFSNQADATVTCSRCGAQAHDPSLLCSPDVTLASSTQLRQGSDLSSSQSSWSETGFGSQSSQSSQSQSPSQSQSQSSLSDIDEELD